MTGCSGDPLRAGEQRERHHGRHVRRHRGHGGAHAAPADRARPGGGLGAVREQRVPGRPAHDAVRPSPAGPAAPMPDRISSWRCTTCSASRTAADWPRHDRQQAFCDAMAGADSRPTRAMPPTTARAHAVARAAPAPGSGTPPMHWRRSSSAMACRSTLSCARAIASSTTRTQRHGRPAEITLFDGGARAGGTARTTLMPLRLDGQRMGVRLDPPRLGQHTQDLPAARHGRAGGAALRASAAVA